MKILVTGGCGFIGSNFIRYLLKHTSDEIINVDVLTYAAVPNKNRAFSYTTQDLKDSKYTFVRGDVRDESLIYDITKEADCIVHFAAESHVDRSILAVEEFLTTNILGTKVVLEAMRKNQIKKLIHISTDEVYGSIKEGKADENYPFKPGNPYSASKAAADLFVQAYINTYNVPALIARPSNNFGPHQYPEKIIPLFIKKLLANEKVPVFGKGLNKRNWIYVEDTCEAIYTLLTKGKIGDAYNISGDNEIPNIELTRKLLNILGKDESYIEFVPDRLGHDWRYAIDDTKLRSLGWKPRHSFEEAIAKTVAWYKENQEWIKHSEESI